MIKGLSNQIKDITVVGKGMKLPHQVVGKISWSPVPGLVYIDVPSQAVDKYMTVLALKLDKPVSLYRGKGGFE
jgi:alpha-L-fucosidase